MTVAANSGSWVVEPVACGALDRLAEWWVRSRGDRVLILVAALWGLNTLDLACTLFADRYLFLGVYGESNPLAAAVMGIGPRAIIVYKLLLVAVGTGVLAALRRRRLADMTALAMTVTYGFVLVRWILYFELVEVHEILIRVGEGGDAPCTFMAVAF